MPSSVIPDTGKGGTFLVPMQTFSLQWLARQLGCHGHGWTGPSGTENKMLSQERRGKLPTLSLTSSLLFIVYWGPDWLKIKRLYLFAYVEDSREGLRRRYRPSLSPGCQTPSVFCPWQLSLFKKEKESFALLWRLQEYPLCVLP